MAKNCGVSSGSKTKEGKSKKTVVKKTPQVPAKRSNSKVSYVKKVAPKHAKGSIALSKGQKAKTSGKTPRKQPAKQVKLSDSISLESAKSNAEKAKDTLKCKSVKTSTLPSKPKARTGSTKRDASKQSKDNAKRMSQKFISPSPKKIKTGLASKATLKQSKGNFKNKPGNKSTLASSKKARTSVASEIAAEQSKCDLKNPTLPKSPKRGRKCLDTNIASKKTVRDFKNDTLPKSPVAKRRRESSALQVVSKKPKYTVKQKTSLELITPPLKKMRTSVAKKNAGESTVSAKQKKMLNSGLPPKSSIQEKTLGLPKSSSTRQTKSKTPAGKRGLKSQANATFSAMKELGSAPEKRSKYANPRTLKQGLKQSSKVKGSVHLQGKKTGKSPAKPASDGKLGASVKNARVSRMKKK